MRIVRRAWQITSVAAAVIGALWCGSAAASLSPSDARASVSDMAVADAPQPQKSAAYTLACLAYLSMGGLQDALTACNHAVQLNPQDADALRLRGALHLLLGDPKQAQIDLALSIARDPFNVQGYELAGKAAFAVGDYLSSVADFNEALLLAPREAEAFDGRGASWQAMKNYDAAERDFGQAIALSPGQPWSWNARCWLRVIANKEPKAALSDCQHAAELAPTEPHIRDSLGWVWMRLDAPDEAIASFDAALSKNTQLASSFYGRGLAKDEVGDVRGGAADIASAKALEPGIAGRFRSYGFTRPAHSKLHPTLASAS
jgi:tetratricopeptide (TPR) repeat protein